MNDKYNLGKYAGLVFTKLDLPQVPFVNVDALLAWMQSADRKVMPEQQNYETVHAGERYPWRPVWAYDGVSWDAEFSQQFPELIEYVKLFPATDWRRVCLLAQRPDMNVFPHVDPDFGIGWRVYLTAGGPQLYFNKYKNWDASTADAQSITNTTKIQERMQAERIYVPVPTEPYAWALTSICAAHSVSTNHDGASARIVILIMPKLDSIDVAAHHELLKRSTETYADSAIWY